MSIGTNKDSDLASLIETLGSEELPHMKEMGRRE